MLGIPYAPADLTETTYGVTCPECNERFSVPLEGDEDEITKEPNRMYAEHYEERHQ